MKMIKVLKLMKVRTRCPDPPHGVKRLPKNDFWSQMVIFADRTDSSPRDWCIPWVSL